MGDVWGPIRPGIIEIEGGMVRLAEVCFRRAMLDCRY
jgi:hypothetical protein